MNARMLFDTPEAVWAAVAKAQSMGLAVASVTVGGITFHPPPAPSRASKRPLPVCAECHVEQSNGPMFPLHKAHCSVFKRLNPEAKPAPTKAAVAKPPEEPKLVPGTPYTEAELFGHVDGIQS